MSAQPSDISVTSDESTLTQLNERYIESFMKSDVEWYRAHLADDFLCIEANGSVLDKDQFLQKTAEGPGLADYRLAQVRIRIFGDVALVHGMGRFRRQDATTGISRYTDIYLRVGSEWKAISAQITRNLTRRKESLL
jgi:ketosteroid isomerase-like protein